MSKKVITRDDLIELKKSVDSMNVLMMTNKVELENEIKELKNELDEIKKAMNKSDDKIAKNEKLSKMQNDTMGIVLDTLEGLTKKQ